MLRTCVYHMAASLLPPFYLIAIKHAFTLYYKHVDHAVFTLPYSHGIYLYKLVSRVSCFYLVFNKTIPLLVHCSQTSKSRQPVLRSPKQVLSLKGSSKYENTTVSNLFEVVTI